MGTRPTDPGASLVPLSSSRCCSPSSRRWRSNLPSPHDCRWWPAGIISFRRGLAACIPAARRPPIRFFSSAPMAFAMAMAGVAGAGQQEAFQLLQNASGIFYALAYLAMFALPLFGSQKKLLKPPLWLQAASVSGFLMTAMYLVLSLFPIIDVPQPWLFTTKVGGFILACQVVAALLYYSYRRRAVTEPRV